MNESEEAKGWSDHADVYQRDIEQCTGQWAHTAMAYLVKLKKGATFLDAACGTGVLGIEAAKQGCEVLATDFSHGMIEALKKKLVNEPELNIRTQILDCLTMEGIEANSFDAVGSSFGIAILPNHASGLQSALRVLKPGGKFILTAWHHQTGQIANVFVPVVKKANPAFDETKFPQTDEQSFKKELVDAGFENVHVYKIQHPFVCSSISTLAKGMVDNAMIGKVVSTLENKLTVIENAVFEAMQSEHSLDYSQDSVNMEEIPACINGIALIGVATKPSS